MMHRSCSFLICLLGYTGLSAPTIAAPPPRDTETVGTQLSAKEKRDLLTRLASDQWQVREAAEQQIVGMGEAARPLVAELLTKTTDAEARARLKLALERIDQDRISGASIITLHMKDATPRQAFDALSRQCFAPLKPFPDNLWDQQKWPTVAVDIDRKPFWEAIAALSEQTGVRLQSAGQGLRLMRDGPARTGRTIVSGAFLVVATEINLSQTISLGDGKRQSNFAVVLWFAPEPKLQVLSGGAESDLQEAIDDRGNSLLPDGADGRASPSGQISEWGWPVTLKYPEQPGTKITRLRGAASFVVQTASQKIKLRDLASIRQKPQAAAGLTIVVQDIKQNGRTYELSLSIRHDGADGRWPAIEQTIYQRLKISDAAGRPFEYRGMSTRGN